MSLLLKQFFELLRLLHSDTETKSIALGLSLGLVLGFSPILSLQTLLILGFCFLFRVQITALFLSSFVFKFIAYLLDPICHQVGRWFLENENLIPLWTQLYNLPLVPFTQFNNTIVMGSGVLSLILSVPLFFLFHYLINKYQKTFLKKLKNSHTWKAVQATSLYRWYHKYNELYS